MLDLAAAKKDYKKQLKALQKRLGKLEAGVDELAARLADPAQPPGELAGDPDLLMAAGQRWLDRHAPADKFRRGDAALKRLGPAVRAAGPSDELALWLTGLELLPMYAAAMLPALSPAGRALLMGWLAGISQKDWSGRRVAAGRLLEGVAGDDDAVIYGLILFMSASRAGQEFSLDLARHYASEAVIAALAEALPTLKSATARAGLAEALRFGARRGALPALVAALDAEGDDKARKALELAVGVSALASERLGAPDRHREVRGRRVAFVGRHFFEGSYATAQTSRYLSALQGRLRFLGAEVVRPSDAPDIVFMDREQAAGRRQPSEDAMGARDLFEILNLRWFCQWDPGDLLRGWAGRVAAQAAKQRAHPAIELQEYALAPGLSQEAIDALAAGGSLPADVRALYREADGATLRWSFADGRAGGRVALRPLADALAAAPAAGATDAAREETLELGGDRLALPAGELVQGLRVFDHLGDGEVGFYLGAPVERPLDTTAHTPVVLGIGGRFNQVRALPLAGYIEGLITTFGSADLRAAALKQGPPDTARYFRADSRTEVMFAYSPA